MAQLIINIPDAIAPRVLNSFAKRFRYVELIDGQPNPETKAQFAKRRVIEFIKQAVKDGEVIEAKEAAEAAAVASVDSDITLS